MIIRQERPADRVLVYDVVKTAFSLAEHADGNEQDLVDMLRKSAAFVPQLSLVAEDNGKIVGHILFTEITVNDSIQLALAPLAVLPEYQRQGIGAALITQGHETARTLGYGYSVVLGSERYYSRFGYLPSEQYGIKPPFAVPREKYMVCKLREDAPKISGTVRYAKEFGIE